MPAQRYTAELAGQIETKWQDRWEELGTFYADNPTGALAGPLASRTPYFILDMFPYPRVRACTWVTRWATSRPIRWRATAA